MPDPSPNPRRRFLRFSLRGLMLVVLVISAALAWAIHEARKQGIAVRALEKAMLDYLDQRNKDLKPFVWKADADLILGKVERLSKRISDSGH